MDIREIKENKLKTILQFSVFWTGTYAPRKCLLGGKGTENSNGASRDHE